MRKLRLRAIAGVLVTGAVLVPATMASASHHSSAKFPLALVPLQRAELGAAGRSLKLDYGSGPKFILDVGLKAFDIGEVAPDWDWRHLGRVARYSLDYGDPFVGSTGVMEISTGVEQYKNPADAKLAYATWQWADGVRGVPNPGGGMWNKIKVPRVGPRHFAYLGHWDVPHLNPIVGLDEHVLAGKFLLDMTVIAGSAKAAKHVAPDLARRLYHRLQSMLRGHLTGKPATLPHKPKPGRAPGGPDLSTMILQPSDVGQSTAPDVTQNYFSFLPSLSAYGMTMSPAGDVFDDYVEQQISWWPTATEATYAEAYQYYELSPVDGLTPVDLTSVGDNATGSSKYVADDQAWVIISLTNGRASDYVVAHGDGYGPKLTDSDVVNLAQAAANRLNAGLGP